jgi:hypothetical protein
MKRGHNFGVVYVTNSTVEEDPAKPKSIPIAKATETMVCILFLNIEFKEKERNYSRGRRS